MSWELVEKGKVRDVYEHTTEPWVQLVASDRVSAFDEELGVSIPGKGRMLTKISKYWFDKTCTMVPNAYAALKVDVKVKEALVNNELPEDTDLETVTPMLKLDMVPVEAIVRGYITGSLWAAYSNPEKPTREFCGVKLPNGMQNSERFPTPIFTPKTKAIRGKHDKNLSFDEMVEHMERNGIMGARDRAGLIRDYSIILYNYAFNKLFDKGIILADTKFEFGVNPITGNIMLGDELLTPDSSRFWSKSEYEPGHDQRSLDKQMIRDFVKKNPGVKVPQSLLEDAAFVYDSMTEIITTN